MTDGDDFEAALAGLPDLAESGEAPEPEPIPDVELPDDVKAELEAMLGALEKFATSITGFLATAHSSSAELVASVEPPNVPGGLDEIEQQIAAWESAVLAQTKPFKDFLARLDADCQPVRDYIVALRKLFEPPVEEPAEGSDAGEPEESPA